MARTWTYLLQEMIEAVQQKVLAHPHLKLLIDPPAALSRTVKSTPDAPIMNVLMLEADSPTGGL